MSERVQELREQIAQAIHIAHQRRIGYSGGVFPWAQANPTYQAGLREDADRVLAKFAGLFTEEQESALREAARAATGQPFRELLGLHDTLAALRAVQPTTDPKEGA